MPARWIRSGGVLRFAQGLYRTLYGEGMPPVDSVNRLMLELPKKPSEWQDYFFHRDELLTADGLRETSFVVGHRG